MVLCQRRHGEAASVDLCLDSNLSAGFRSLPKLWTPLLVGV